MGKKGGKKADDGGDRLTRIAIVNAEKVCRRRSTFISSAWGRKKRTIRVKTSW